MKVIGLTGGIGSGKSTVARFLAELGAEVLDADRVGHEALRPGGEAWEQVVSEFGRDMISASGDIDRARLGRLVFNNSEARSRLNRIMHPVIYNMVSDRLEAYRRRGVKIAVLETALLLEVSAKQVDDIWVTTAPEATVIRRLTERGGLSEDEARARIRSQLPDEARIKHADVVIDTDCSLEELKNKVTELWQRLQSQESDPN